MTELTYAVTIVASILFVLLIIYPLLKGVKKAPESVHFSINIIDVLKNNLGNEQTPESKEILKESIQFLEDKNKEYEKTISGLISSHSNRKYIICLKDDCYTPIKSSTKKCPSCSININKDYFNL